MKLKRSKILVLVFSILVICCLLAGYIVLRPKTENIPPGYREIKSYNPNGICLAMMPECGVCEETFGGYKLIDGKCYGRTGR